MPKQQRAEGEPWASQYEPGVRATATATRDVQPVHEMRGNCGSVEDDVDEFIDRAVCGP